MTSAPFETQMLETIVRPCLELPGQWEAEVLRLGIVTYGHSYTAAIDAAVEAVDTCVEDDIRSGRDPMTRLRSPHDAWMLYHHAKANGVAVPFTLVDEVVSRLGAPSEVVVATEIYAWFVRTVDELPLEPHGQPLHGANRPAEVRASAEAPQPVGAA